LVKFISFVSKILHKGTNGRVGG